VRGISHLGGTIIGSTNKGNPIAYPVQQDDGTWTEVDRSDELIGRFADASHGRVIVVEVLDKWTTQGEISRE
jgi:hypothetical protein